MHTLTTSNGLTIHHNGDFDGLVMLMVPSEFVEDGGDTSAVQVPFQSLKELVAAWVRSEWIGTLEQANPDELLLETKMG